MPIVTLSTCSINIGQISAVNRCRLNSGADRETVASIVSNTSYAKFRSTAAVRPPLYGGEKGKSTQEANEPILRRQVGKNGAKSKGNRNFGP